jgi:two-component system response regulator YesN
LLPDAQSVLICGRVDNATDKDGCAEKQARVKTLFYQYTRSIGNSFLFFEGNDRYLHGIFQPHSRRQGAANILCEALERMQEACAASTGLELSFIVDDREVGFEKLPARFTELSQFVRYWLNEQQRLQLLRAGYFAQRIDAGELADLRHRPVQAEVLNQLRSAVENTDRCAYEEALLQVKKILASSGEESLLRMEVLGTTISILAGCINKRRLEGQMPSAACTALHALFSKSPDEIFECLAAFGEQLFSAIESTQRNKDEAFVEDIHECIDQHLSQSITLLHLAQHLHFNAAYLSRLYKQLTGVNLSNTILERKMDRAKELIRQSPHLKIGEVAAKVGFEYPAYFTRVFKKHFGISPQEYKEKMI